MPADPLAEIRRNGYPCDSPTFWRLVDDATLLAAALDVIGRLLDGRVPEPQRDVPKHRPRQWKHRTLGYYFDDPITGGEQAVLAMVKDRGVSRAD